jgi:RNA polymerase sigma factor (TIGR02999 family)
VSQRPNPPSPEVPAASGGDATSLLNAWAEGDAEAAERLIGLVYADLRSRAAAQLRRERRDHTLQPTALAHEAFVRLADQRMVRWQSRTHFLALASRIMRRVLVDYARARAAAKRPDDALRVVFPDELVIDSQPIEELLILDDALTELARIDPRQGCIVEHRYFGGLSEQETAEVLAISRSTVAREWRSARAWLLHRMTSPQKAST